MNMSHRYFTLLLLAGSLTACADDHLTTEPPTILTEDQVWTNPTMIDGVLANFYGRMPDYMSFNGGVPHVLFANYDEALYSGITNTDQVNGIVEYPYNTGATGDYWVDSYQIVRDINLAIDNIGAAESQTLTPQIKAEYIAELRFLRGWVYFDMVKRVGGVPIITEQLIYDFSGDPSYLQRPRDTEEAVYDFIGAEMDEIIPVLGNEGLKSRANRFTALALKSRAMLYAGSLARHNNEMPGPITLPGGEVGIPASRAVDYYQQALDASREIINSGEYALYEANPDVGVNFYEALTVKSGNPEVIWAKDYNAAGGVNHLWTLSILPPTQRTGVSSTNQGAGLSPSLQLAETYDFLDGSDGVFPGVGDGTPATQDEWTFYDEPDDIFEGKDGRFYGTIIYPGTSVEGGLKGQVEMQAGVYVWNDATGRYDKVEGPRGSTYEDGGLLTGLDGPRGIENYLSTTGFYVRKYVDPNPLGGTSTTGSDVWWVRFRLGEVYLNAAEAAFELGQTDLALDYINRLRERAGFPANSLTTLSRDKIREERTAELAFEDHRFWDLKRWRIAHLVWDGSDASETANIWSLWGYRIVRPGHPDHGKYVYDKFPSQRQTAPRYFRVGNYYSAIPGDALGSNPLLVPNPFH